MPAVRSSRQPLQAQHAPNFAGAEVIVLSSDEDDAPPPPRKATLTTRRSAKGKGKAKARPSPAREGADVLEVTSEEDTPLRRRATSSRTTISQLQKQLDQLQRENEQLKREASRGVSGLPPQLPRIVPAVDEKTISALKASEAAAVASKKKLLVELEEHVTCEICTLKMWTPYLLVCGHSFCQSCLQDWFGTTLAQHMNTHPQYDLNPPVLQQYLAYLRQPNLQPAQRRAIEREVQMLHDNTPQPSYTCPTCRDPVKTAPIEAFSLKHVVRTVAQAEGETSPKRATSRGAHARRKDGPWDGFFPKVRF